MPPVLLVAVFSYTSTPVEFSISMPATLNSAWLRRTMMSARLADVDAGVGRADGDRILDQHVLALHRIDAVGAVLLVGGRAVHSARTR